MKIWQVICGIAVILGIIGSFFVIENRWNQSDEVFAAEKEMTHMKKETVETFQQVQMQMKRNDDKLDKKFTLQMNTIVYDNLNEQYYRLKREVKSNPDDSELREEFENVKKRRKETKKRINDSVK